MRVLDAEATPEAERARGVLLAGLVCFVVLVGWLLLASAPALALSQRGHAFSFSFGGEGSGEGQLDSPSAIAVNDSDGDVYVADRANNRVEEFEPVVEHGELVNETFVMAFEVLNPERIAVDNSTSTSDPSSGDVYVAGTTTKAIKEGNPEDRVVYKFSATGAPLGKPLKKFKEAKHEGLEEFEPIEGLAVDSTGDLWVYDEEDEIANFTNAVENKPQFSIETEFETGTPGLAINSAGDFYAGHVSENQAAVGLEGQPSVVGKCEAELVERECETLIAELDQQTTTAVAVDGANEVYIANLESIAGKQVTSIVALSPGGSVVQRFGQARLIEGSGIALDSHGGVYVTDASSDTVYVFEPEPPGPPTVDSLSACVTSHCTPAATAVRLTAEVDPSGADTGAHFEYGTASCASATCASTGEEDLGGGFGDKMLAAELTLQPGVTYHFRVVAKNEHGEVTSSERTFTIPVSVGELPDGRAWEMVSSPNKDGLEPEPIVGFGGAVQASRDGDAMTYIADGPIPVNSKLEGSRNPESAQILSVRGSTEWTSQDTFTAVSKGEGILAGAPGEYQAFSPNLSLALLQPFPGSPETGPFEEPVLSPKLKFKDPEGEEVTEGEQEKSIYVRDDAPLLPEAGNAAEESTYAAAEKNGEIMKNAGYLALVSEENALGVLGGPKPGEAQFGGGFEAGVELVTATPDLSHVLIKSYRAAPGLYEWGPGGQLQLVSLLPKNETGEELPATGNLVFGDRPDLRDAVSNSGSRVFWTRVQGEESDLYVRDTETHETLQLDAVVSGAGEGRPSAGFQTASADGSKVFFTDAQRLTSDSNAAGTKPDLYVFELSPPGQPLSGTLTDLTPAGIHGESADVQGQGRYGGVLGASEDGSYVYFVANGALAPENTPGDCGAAQEPELVPARECNLYVSHFSGTQWEAPQLIGVLSNDDSPDWGGEVGTGQFRGDLGWMTSRVSPDGRYLAFMSDRSLTGQDNEDVTSQAAGERLDEEVFLYHDAGLESSLVCASCNPSGARPAGVFDAGKEPQPVHEVEEGVGLVVDRLGIWGLSDTGTAHWLAGSVPGWTSISIDHALYQSRYLLNDGRLFFNSPDHLVPAATGAKEKVYEYEPNGVGTCATETGCVGLLSSPNSEGEATGEHESAFLDASESGNDVFLLTAARLPAVNGTTADADSNFDVYDVRVCAQDASGCLPGPALGSAGCADETTCKSAAPRVPPFVAPASASVPASGNVAGSGALPNKVVVKPKPLTPAQRLAKALKSCKKDKGKSKRVACEKKAHSTYRAEMLTLTLKNCKKDKSKGKRVACEKTARKKY